ncbi:hypothetical protein RRG08_010624 [Elysia crispata]|uniref:Uncharacterized protein n=1 Tax=Elysia crispata TaxID=231223 RepID=A0AAE1CPW1_9GAST|nr:hypothetical protein RRG08_010624 [Elysia crispata]
MEPPVLSACFYPYSTGVIARRFQFKQAREVPHWRSLRTCFPIGNLLDPGWMYLGVPKPKKPTQFPLSPLSEVWRRRVN